MLGFFEDVKSSVINELPSFFGKIVGNGDAVLVNEKRWTKERVLKMTLV